MKTWMGRRFARSLIGSPSIAAALALAVAPPATAAITAPAASPTSAVGRWTSIGPGGGDVTALAFAAAPSPGAAWIAAAGTVYKSVDGTRSWSWSGHGLACPVTELAVADGAAPGTLYAAGSDARGAAVFRSTDGGAAWAQVYGDGRQGLGSSVALAVAAGGGSQPASVYFGRGGRLVRSVDGGVTWQPVFLDPSRSAPQIVSIAVDPGNPRVAYLSDLQGIWKTSDGGASWQARDDVPGQPPVGFISALAVAPSDPRVVYAVGFPTSYRSEDGAETWLPIPFRGDAVAVDSRRATQVYAHGAGTGGTVSSSLDGGETWQDSSAGLPGTFNSGFSSFEVRLVADPARSGVVYLLSGLGVFVSRDGGRRWAAGLQSGLTADGVDFLRFDPFHPGTLVGGFSSGLGSVLRSADGGAHWMPFGPSVFETFEAAFDPFEPGAVYATASQGVFASSDGGLTWEARSPRVFTRIAVVAPGVLLGGDFGAIRSLDGGRTWVDTLGPEIPNPADDPFALFTQGLVVDPLRPGVVYAEILAAGERPPSATFSAIYRSRDAGLTWRLWVLGDRVVPDPGRAGRVYLLSLFGAAAGIQRTDDDGRHWTALALPAGAGRPVALAVGAEPPGAVYVAAPAGGVLRSRDAGVTWEPLDAGLPPRLRPCVEGLVADPAGAGRLFALTGSCGLLAGVFPPPPAP